MLGGCRGAHLRLADAEEGLLLVEVHLDVPTPDVVLYDLLRVQDGIGAKEEGRLAVVVPVNSVPQAGECYTWGTEPADTTPKGWPGSLVGAVMA